MNITVVQLNSLELIAQRMHIVDTYVNLKQCGDGCVLCGVWCGFMYSVLVRRTPTEYLQSNSDSFYCSFVRKIPPFFSTVVYH